MTLNHKERGIYKKNLKELTTKVEVINEHVE